VDTVATDSNRRRDASVLAACDAGVLPRCDPSILVDCIMRAALARSAAPLCCSATRSGCDPGALKPRIAVG
jgi:hypothetical protein